MASSKGSKNGRLILYDSMAVPGQQVSLVADLLEEALFTHAPLGGEVLLFLHEGRALGRAMTGGDGRAVKSFVPSAFGVAAVTVRVEDTRRVTAPESTARVFIWNRKRPIIIGALSALVPRSRGPAVGLPMPDFGAKAQPPDGKAIEALSAVTRHANLIYVTAADRMELSELRRWANQHRLPAGPIFLLKGGSRGLARELEAWQREGWSNIKGGLVGTADEAKALLAKGVKAIVSPGASPKEKWPDKTIKTKDWTDVAQQLLS